MQTRTVKTAISLAALMTAALRIWSPEANAYSGIVVFGDSNSDTGNPATLFGNVPPSPPYFEHRFSNGPVWVERLAERLGLPGPVASERGGTNYAWGGATTGSVPNPFGVIGMDAQVLEYLATRSPAPDELFVLWGGGNDFSFGQTNPNAPVQFLATQISNLAAAGARNFLVGNLPANQAGISLNWAQRFNSALSMELHALRASQPEVNIIEFDYFSSWEEHKSNPSAFGFTNVFNPACGDCGVGLNANPTNIVPNSDEYYFWDDVHWTATAHRLIGDTAFAVIPEPSSVFLALAAAAALRIQRKRRPD